MSIYTVHHPLFWSICRNGDLKTCLVLGFSLAMSGISLSLRYPCQDSHNSNHESTHPCGFVSIMLDWLWFFLIHHPDSSIIEYPWISHTSGILQSLWWQKNIELDQHLGAPLTQKHINQNSVVDPLRTSRTPGLSQRKNMAKICRTCRKMWRKGGKNHETNPEVGFRGTHRKSKIMKHWNGSPLSAAQQKKPSLKTPVPSAKWPSEATGRHFNFQIFQVQPLVPASPQ